MEMVSFGLQTHTPCKKTSWNSGGENEDITACKIFSVSSVQGLLLVIHFIIHHVKQVKNHISDVANKRDHNILHITVAPQIL